MLVRRKQFDADVKSLATVRGSPLLRCFLRCGDWFDLEPFACRIAWIRDDHIPLLKAGGHFEAVTVVPANLDRLEMHGVIGPD